MRIFDGHGSRMSLRHERLGLKSAVCYVAPSVVTVTLNPKCRDVRAEAKHLHLALANDGTASSSLPVPTTHHEHPDVRICRHYTPLISMCCERAHGSLDEEIHPRAAGDGAAHGRVQDEGTSRGRGRWQRRHDHRVHARVALCARRCRGGEVVNTEEGVRYEKPEVRLPVDSLTPRYKRKMRGAFTCIHILLLDEKNG